MDCPTCQSKLERKTYESEPLFRCEKCHGYFVELDHFKIIRSKRDHDTSALYQEIAKEATQDSLDVIRCPRCRKKMKKEQIGNDQAAIHFLIDNCDDCKSVWFDGGELAKAQVKYEESAQALEEFRRRLALTGRSPEQKATLTKNIKQLGDSLSAVPIAFFYVVLIALFFATIFAKGLGFGLVAAGSCFLFSVGLAVVALALIDGAIEERLVAGGILLAGVAASIALVVL